MWVVVRIMAPFWVPNIARHRIFRVAQKGTLILTTTHVFERKPRVVETSCKVVARTGLAPNPTPQTLTSKP